jgi:predicted transposase YdaD
MIDHDGNFKKLLTTFFHEFVELFFPHIAACLVPDSVEFLSQEFFLDQTTTTENEEQKRIVDISAKVCVLPDSPLALAGRELFFIIHLEQQSEQEADFEKRMFRYSARFMDRYNLPVYPIALFTFDKPFKAQQDRYTVQFLDETIIDFRYKVIQLNRLNWRDFVKQSNPIACALMAKMKIAKADRPRVKLECLRLLATLKLERGRSRLITSFVDEYLLLEAQEAEQFQDLIAKLPPKEREQMVLTTTSWKEEGRLEGQLEGRLEGRSEGRLEAEREMLLEQLTHKFGQLPSQVVQQIEAINTSEKLKQLAIVVIDAPDIEIFLKAL